jgi:four helix bundle protein
MSRKRFPFEKLEVWQEARKLVKEVHTHTRAYPRTEVYGLTAQVNRAALSVANNLAEGSSRISLKDQAHFSNQAYGSLMETASDIIIATDLGYVDEYATEPILNHAYDLSVRIHNLRQSQLTRAKP